MLRTRDYRRARGLRRGEEARVSIKHRNRDYRREDRGGEVNFKSGRRLFSLLLAPLSIRGGFYRIGDRVVSTQLYVLGSDGGFTALRWRCNRRPIDELILTLSEGKCIQRALVSGPRHRGLLPSTVRVRHAL